jgi:hypothetical protein
MNNAIRTSRTAVLLSAAAVVFLVLGGGSRASAAVRGSIAGKVFDSSTKKLVPNVSVAAATITGEETLAATTDESGTFFMAGAPAAVYSFSLRVEGVDFPVRERMDVRVAMPFLLESCFELDRATRTAAVRRECQSGFVEEARVATIGPHRFLLPEGFQDATQPAAGDLQPGGTGIEHDGIECLTHDHFPLVDAAIRPGATVQTSRVYFRSDKYPDFYYVDMTGSHPTVDDFRAVLPKPGPETERIIYYVESVDTNFDTVQTPEFDPEVIAADECARRGVPAWWTGDDPSIIIGATAPGAAAIPPGFQAVGITGFVNSLGVLTSIGGGAGGAAAGTAVSTVLVVSGGAAAAAATGIVVATGGDEASPPK